MQGLHKSRKQEIKRSHESTEERRLASLGFATQSLSPGEDQTTAPLVNDIKGEIGAS